MKKIVTKTQVLSLIIVLVVLLGVGTLFDYQISLKLFNHQSLFGKFFAAYGQLPTALASVMGGYLLVVSRKSNKKIQAFLSITFGTLITLMGTFMIALEPILYLNMNKPLAVFLSLIFTIITLVILNKCTGNFNQRTLQSIALFLIFIVFSQLIIINIIKVPWGRPRMRLIATDSRTPFMPWYKPQIELRDSFFALGFKAEEFKSFPSGHAGASFNILFITLIPYLSSRFESKKCLFWLISITFGFIVSLSRIVIGAHFLSDVVIGLGISFIVYLLAVYFFQRHNNRYY